VDIFAVQFDVTSLGSFDKASRPQNTEWAVLSTCSCLITIVSEGESQVVQFSHSSVKEFLTSQRLAAAEERLSYYHILPKPAHIILAHISLSVLLHLDDEIDRDTIAHFPLAPYAARHWVDHAKFTNVSSHIQAVMNRLFDPAKPHFAAWVWLYDIDRYWTERMPTMHPTLPEAVPLWFSHNSITCRLSQDKSHRFSSEMVPIHNMNLNYCRSLLHAFHHHRLRPLCLRRRLGRSINPSGFVYAFETRPWST